ncbi:MAG: RecQ family ATP-dependent DNA helicase [Bacteroidales bacterium]|jgi:ATP-dependent DNA helicase RecQ|nr:RecQ family ATP-dependent DNA helicase [Bacteroidales bacterium]MDD4057651.1 RecQ family ATP-dependent DNA helicase [Bacteroidales bacterium]
MSKSLEILERYWGYTSFRENQEEIINSALSGNDTVALMPTGGGKSITFQIPALIQDGIALVITPLIALIKDQTESLRSKGIPVIAIHSGMSSIEIDALLDNAIMGEYKFLYLSPERLSSDLFKARVSKMNVSYLIIDEAHCISQWGHDFRPDYLKIKEIKSIISPISTIAVTATATPAVVEEIIKNLELLSPNIIKSSFKRDNLSYVCREDTDKYGQLLKIVRNVSGSGIIYVRERRKTFEVSEFLQAHGVSAEPYNAALAPASRALRQDEWKNGNLRIIVATNAFGMGIDKADVRFVCHLDPPESIEAYYQEAGRAGRDGAKSYAVMLWNIQDAGRLRKILNTTFPEQEYIRNVYQKLFVYLGIAYGAGKDRVINFSLKDFCSKSSLHPVPAYHALKYISKEDYIELTDEIDNPSKVKFIINRDELYNVQLKNNSLDAFIKTLLRLYSGLFSMPVAIDEEYIARVTRNSKAAISSSLMRLSRMGVISYNPAVRSPLLILKTERLDDKNFRIDESRFFRLKSNMEAKIESVIAYFESKENCREKIILEYFGEVSQQDCGRCDVCLSSGRRIDSSNYYYSIEEKVFNILSSGPKSMAEISLEIDDDSRLYIEVVRDLVERGAIIVNKDIFSLSDNLNSLHQ